MKGISTLIHLAGPDAHTISKNPDSIILEHLELTGRLVHAAEVNDVKKIIYYSTIHVYGKNLKGTITEATRPIPVHPFAEAHLEAENIIKSQSKEIVATIIRGSHTFGTPYFENEKCWKLVMNNLCKSAFQNGKLTIKSSGQDYRDFNALENVVRAIHHLLELNNEKEIHDIYNLGSSHTVRIIEIAKKIQKELKDSFDYDCPIIKNKPSKEMNKPKHFIKVCSMKILVSGSLWSTWSRLAYMVRNHRRGTTTKSVYHDIVLPRTQMPSPQGARCSLGSEM